MLCSTGDSDLAPSSRATILLVEDDPSLLDMLRRTLERAGFAVITAPEGRAALALFRLGTIDLVVTDILLPELDGFELIRRLKSDSPNVPIIAMSGINDSAGYRQLARQAGADIAMAKPIIRAQLVDTVSSLLAKHPRPAVSSSC
jgi:two-component system, OmpR family, response regulator